MPSIFFTIQYTFLSNYLRNSKSFKDSDDIWRQCKAYVLHYYFAVHLVIDRALFCNRISWEMIFELSLKHRRTPILSIWIFPVRHDSIFSLFIDHQYYFGMVVLVLYQLAQSLVVSGVKCQNMTSPKLKAAADEKFSYPIVYKTDGY